MENKNQNVEILAPAGSYESLKAAVNAGCDAVYIGGSRFGARAFANNLDEETMLEAIDYIHVHNKKIYMTVNTLLKEKELEEELYDYLLPFYKAGLDAVIVQDLGVLHFIHEHFPDLPIHASTQMTLTGSYGIRLLEGMGVTRLVPARELSLEEIKDLRANTTMEIETFVHGALCYCYSGQCLLSSMIGGRSGNRGRCAQPCRMVYGLDGEKKKNPYKLSPKDICTLDIIPELIEAGIDSFKIEGRMKRPEYTAYTSYLYRKYTDLYLSLGALGYEEYKKAHKKEQEKERKNLMDLYNRGSFTTGYYTQYHGENMMSMSRPNHNGVLVGTVKNVKGTKATFTLNEDISGQDVLEFRNKDGVSLYDYTVKNDIVSGSVVTAPFKAGCKIEKGNLVYRTKNQKLLHFIEEKWITTDRKVPIRGIVVARVANPFQLILAYGQGENKIVVDLKGDIVDTAVRQPVTKEKLSALVNQISDTKYKFTHLEVEMEEDIFIPVGKVKMLRRQALEQLEQKILEYYRRNEPKARTRDTKVQITDKTKEERKEKNTFFVVISRKDQLEPVLKQAEIKRVGLEVDLLSQKEAENMAKEIKEAGKECFLALPRIYRKGKSDDFVSYENENTDGYLVRSMEQIGFLKSRKTDKIMMLDFNLYTMNREAKKFYHELEIDEYTTSVELNYKEIKETGTENSAVLVYGHIPLMVTAQCLLKNQGICEKNLKQKAFHTLTDRVGKQYFVSNHCKHCYNVIYDGTPLSLLEESEMIKKWEPSFLRLDFTIEGKEETELILKYFVEAFRYNKKTEKLEKTTKGHFYRGIE